ncbi:hypothetical protein [Streptomyces sp. NBC_01198]|uniref:hypothetical protein n=1 Tax=Streptomyces sp. NBC_01198 TaxID=2903769 RepID=UPI002E0EBFFB|nr:hypothetical protein OG702_05930 [Streptomyces sp. NBC_01198]
MAFNPNSDGSYRVVVASPSWTGGNANSTASTLIGSDTTASRASLLATQSAWWHNFWAGSGLIEASSSDGTAQYMENLNTLYEYFEAGLMHSGQYPGSQAGLADLYNFNQDHQAWYPAGYWLWNLRGQIQANLDAGNFAQNVPIFDMYLNDLPAIESWTSASMNGKPGACVPETQWAVQDPTTDIAADQALFTATVSAASLLGTDSSLVSPLRTALTHIEPYARTDQNSRTRCSARPRTPRAPT